MLRRWAHGRSNEISLMASRWRPRLAQMSAPVCLFSKEGPLMVDVAVGGKRSVALFDVMDGRGDEWQVAFPLTLSSDKHAPS